VRQEIFLDPRQGRRARVGGDEVHQVVGVSFRRRQNAAGQAHHFGHRARNPHRQKQRPDRRKYCEFDLRQSQLGIGCGENPVAGGREFQSAAQTLAAYDGDQRVTDVQKIAKEVVEARQRPVDLAGPVLGDAGPKREMCALTFQNDGFDAGIVLGAR
jgi:hypothetical protein